MVTGPKRRLRNKRSNMSPRVKEDEPGTRVQARRHQESLFPEAS